VAFEAAYRKLRAQATNSQKSNKTTTNQRQKYLSRPRNKKIKEKEYNTIPPVHTHVSSSSLQWTYLSRPYRKLRAQAKNKILKNP
jgi:hypothetical protein